MPDTRNNLILVKGKDQTASIKGWRFEKKKPVVWIDYGSKEYPYNTSDVRFFKDPVLLDAAGKQVFDHGRLCAGVETVQNFGDYARLIYDSGFSKVVSGRTLEIKGSALCDDKSRDRFEYLKQLANEIGLHTDSGHNILAARYETIDFIREDSMLATFLSGKIEERGDPERKTALYPFGFNLSQKQAVDRALNHKLSVIAGPPGTGKTQTILNIIANAVVRGESVAVVSGNNAATANILEKLEKHGLAFIAAYLGNSSNKEAFVNSQTGKIPDLTEWELSGEECSEQYRKLESDGIELDRMLAKKNALACMQSDLDALQKEYRNYAEMDSEEGAAAGRSVFRRSVSADKILEFLAEYEMRDDAAGKLNFFQKLSLVLRYRLCGLKALNAPTDRILSAGRHEYYHRKLDALESSIRSLSSQLKAFDFDRKMQAYTAGSLRFFKAYLARRYHGSGNRKIYALEDLWKHSADFVRDYPVVLSTTYSIRSSLSSGFFYDYVIVDEASQVDLLTGALAFSCARKAVVVGDLKQLPNVVSPEQREKAERLFARYRIPSAYNYCDHSLLSFVTEQFGQVPETLLREHYRCHPEIIGFCNQRFYNDELILMRRPSGGRQALLVYRTVKGNHARGHLNQRQIDVIREEVIPEQGLDLTDGSVGIVTPYRAQADALQAAFSGTNVQADTADKFQGQERSVMIFSTVDNEIGEFASDPNRLNVAVSRAIDQFIVVTDGNENDNDSPIHDLIAYIQYQNHSMLNSRVRSVFDCLYKDQAAAREKVLRKYGRVSDVDSESLMYRVIMDVLDGRQRSEYGIVMHVPLRMIVNDGSNLTERELQFAHHRRTHVDFLIFSKLTHTPILVVEVDGFAYHAASAAQQERDSLKDSVLAKCGIPIVRFSTVGSGEKEKLQKALSQLQ